MWERRFGADPSVVGTAITLNGEPYVIVGVLPRSFSFLGAEAQIFVPMAFEAGDNLNTHNNHFLRMIGRLKTGVTRQQANADLNGILKAIVADEGVNQGLVMDVIPLRDVVVGRDVRRALIVLLAAVGFVLLITCANLANLLLSRAAARQREIAVRLALGASRRRLVGQFLVESLLFSLVGATLGLAIAYWSADALNLVSQRVLPRAGAIHLDGSVLMFSLAIATATGLLLGLAPAAYSAGAGVGADLKSSSRSSSDSLGRSRLRSVLVAAEVALTLVLLAGAGLMIRSMYELLHVPAGFDADGVLTAQLNVPAQKYVDRELERRSSPLAYTRATAFFTSVVDRIRAVPGAEAVGAINGLPLMGEVWGKSVTLYDRPLPADADHNIAPGKLAEFYAESSDIILTDVHSHVTVIDRCPNRTELDQAATTGKIEKFEGFFERADHARSGDPMSGRKAVPRSIFSADTSMKHGFGPRRAAIDGGRSNNPAIAEIVGLCRCWRTTRGFRLRSVRLGDKQRAIFRALRSKESDLSLVSPADLNSCIRATIGREARLAWKSSMETSNPDVRFDQEAVEAKVASLAQADAQIRDCNRELLIHGINSRRVRPTREWEAITRLRGPRSLRLREFIERAAPLGLFALRPVWLMTPDVASRVLQPRPGIFDTVIFDEASQMPVEYALPSLFRSRIVIVSGDEKQMPPTTFFASKVENDEAAIFDGEEPEDEATEEEREAFAETWNRREIKDCPDLLQLARTALQIRTPKVHYRSKYRELISFSNASFYANGLSVPVRHPDDTIRRIKPIEVVRSDGTSRARSIPRRLPM